MGKKLQKRAPITESIFGVLKTGRNYNSLKRLEKQKGIILGKQASRLVEVREKARLILNSVFDRHTRLFLRVKVVKNWRKNEQFINEVVFGNRK